MIDEKKTEKSKKSKKSKKKGCLIIILILFILFILFIGNLISEKYTEHKIWATEYHHSSIKSDIAYFISECSKDLTYITMGTISVKCSSDLSELTISFSDYFNSILKRLDLTNNDIDGPIGTAYVDYDNALSRVY